MNTVRIRLFDEDENLLLVFERSQEKKVTNGSFIKPSAWGLPGGRAKPDEMPYETAERELYEETGLSADIDKEPVMILKKSEDNIVYVFNARNPCGTFNSQSNNILAGYWIPWKFTGEPLDYKGKKYPVYYNHIRFAHLLEKKASD